MSDSGLEAQRLRELILLQRGGNISDLAVHASVNVEPGGCEPITWRIDFRYVENGVVVYEDSKSEATYGGEARIKAKLLRARYPEAIFRISYRDGKAIRVRDVHRVSGTMIRAALLTLAVSGCAMGHVSPSGDVHGIAIGRAKLIARTILRIEDLVL